MENNIVTKKNLDEISFIRPILIVLLVLYHAFAPYCGAWKPFEGFHENTCYWWIGRLAYSFMLPTFVFISSYVFSFQRETLCRVEKIGVLVIKKARRLLLPSILFSLIYLPLLSNIEDKGLVHNVLLILSGAGHMWFLPMLFWLFPLLCLLLKIRSVWIRFAISLVFAIGPSLPLPLQIGTSLSYLFYFLLGYEFYRNVENIKEHTKSFNIYIIWFLFILMFVGLTVVKRDYLISIGEETFVFKLIRIISINTLTLLYSTFGLFAIYLTALRFICTRHLSSWIVKIGSYCFGVYIFQQFVLLILYYHTSLFKSFGVELLPWIGFVISLIISLLLSYLLRLTRIGRNLI